MIGRAFYSTTASTDDIFVWIFCQSTSDIHCYRDVKSIPWNITKSVSRAGFSNLPTPPLIAKHIFLSFVLSVQKHSDLYELKRRKAEKRNI